VKVKLRPIFWLGDSKDVIRSWSEGTRKRAGEELFRLQLGSDPLHWRSIKSVGRGVREIKISQGGAYRVFYVVRRGERIVVLHAFEKKTQRTAKSDIERGKQRLKSSE
jgi:putative addiction module killer protein